MAKAGPPLGSVRGPTRIVEATQAQASSDARGDVVPAIVVGSTRLTACSGNCVLPASASGLPIRPVLKHGPRSLTCVRVTGLENP